MCFFAGQSVEKLNVNGLSLHFVDVSEARVEYERICTPPFDTFTVVVDDGGATPHLLAVARGKSIRGRVSGFSATFVDLTESIRDNVIARIVNPV